MRRQIQQMDELRQIITYKLKLIQQYRDHAAHTPEDRLQLAELLIKEKRKETSRDVIESRLLQSLTLRKIEAPYRIQEFYNQSLELMQMYTPGFEHAKQSKPDSDAVESIVSLYVTFFMRQDCERRAEELRHIYSKNLCERGVIIPTVLHWFAEWLRKTYRDFIKKTLADLNDKHNSQSSLAEERKISRNKKFMEEINAQRASLSLISSEIQNHKQKEHKLQSNKSLMLVGMSSGSPRQNPASQLLNPPPYLKSVERLKSQPCAEEGISSSPQNNPLPSSSDYGSVPVASRQKAVYLNKDIFFSAFFEEINSYYKFNSVAMSGELDENYPRSFRKVDRRQEINKNLTVLVKSLARNQPSIIKQQIDKYYDNYRLKFGNGHANVPQDYATYNQLDANAEKLTQRLKIRKKQKQMQKDREKRRAQSVNLKNSIENQTRMSQSIEGRNNSETNHSQSAKHSSQRVEAEKKKVELALPQIKSKHVVGRSVQKIILVNHEAQSRYSKSKILPERVSAELYKQLRQINGLFKNNGRRISSRLNRSKQDALFIDKSILHEADIRWGKELSPRDNQIGELLDGHFEAEADGIFRLPKLCR